jgi:hypothetical protein
LRDNLVKVGVLFAELVGFFSPLRRLLLLLSLGLRFLGFGFLFCFVSLKFLIGFVFG